MSRRQVVILTSGGKFQDATATGIRAALAGRNIEVVHQNVGPSLDIFLRETRPTLCFLALDEHSPWVPRTLGILELLGIPYTGSGISTSSQCRDRLATLQLLGANGLPVPAFAVLHRDYADEAAAHFSGLSFPIEVCTATADGTSTQIDNQDDLPAVADDIFAYGDRVIAFELWDGKRVSAFTYDDSYLGAVEKHTDGTKSAVDLSTAVLAHVSRMACKAHQVLACRGLAEVEFLLSDVFPLAALGVNPNPSLHPGGAAAMAADSAGVSHPDLINRIVDAGFRWEAPKDLPNLSRSQQSVA